ncbi:hypothetical protein GCM10028805_02330 [Spirosoma harenae]
MSIQIKAAHTDQLPALIQLLSDNKLPTDDLPAGLPYFWLAFDNDKLIGSVGIEVYSSIGLLRSVCVSSNYRNQRIAERLYELAIQEARRQRINDVYLLTTTADGYFERLGFSRIARASAPEPIQQTAQFGSLCPSSAVVMKQTV